MEREEGYGWEEGREVDRGSCVGRRKGSGWKERGREEEGESKIEGMSIYKRMEGGKYSGGGRVQWK